jgi:hypothetical protein
MTCLADYEGIGSKYGRVFLWTTPKFYTPMRFLYSRTSRRSLENVAGPFDAFVKKVDVGTIEERLGLLRMYTPFKTVLG